MSDITFPTLSRIPRDLTFGIVWNTQVSTSPLSGAVQTLELPGARWQISFRLSDREEADSVLIQAHLLKLRGRVNRSLIYNFARPVPRGTIAGTPLVNGASQTGNTLAIDGCTAGTTLLAGDFFSVNDELKMLTADATANGAGAMSLSLDEPIRTSPSDNSAIVTASPTCIMRLASDEIAADYQAGRFSSFTLEAVETFA